VKDFVREGKGNSRAEEIRGKSDGKVKKKNYTYKKEKPPVLDVN